MKALHLVVIGLAAATVSLQAQTYYFTPTGPTTATNRNTYSTSSAGIDFFFTLGTTTGDFVLSTDVTSDTDSSAIIAAYVAAGSDYDGDGTSTDGSTPPWVVPAGDFSLNTSFTTYAGSHALWMNPNNPTTVQQYQGITADAWTYGTWEAVVTFQVDDVNLYGGFFLEGQTYADDEVTLTLNGHVISVPSQNTAWQLNPPPASQVMLDPSFLATGANTLVFTIANTNPGASPIGPSGLAAYGRVGGTLAVPEPGTAGLIAFAMTGLILSRRRR
jgi:hypothetical protein